MRKIVVKLGQYLRKIEGILFDLRIENIFFSMFFGQIRNVVENKKCSFHDI